MPIPKGSSKRKAFALGWKRSGAAPTMAWMVTGGRWGSFIRGRMRGTWFLLAW